MNHLCREPIISNRVLTKEIISKSCLLVVMVCLIYQTTCNSRKVLPQLPSTRRQAQPLASGVTSKIIKIIFGNNSCKLIYKIIIKQSFLIIIYKVLLRKIRSLLKTLILKIILMITKIMRSWGWKEITFRVLVMIKKMSPSKYLRLATLIIPLE